MNFSKSKTEQFVVCLKVNQITYEHMNATHVVANLFPGAILQLCANLHQGANCAYKRGFRLTKALHSALGHEM